MHTFEPGAVALGCMSLPLHDEALCRRILLHAVELGIRLFDTADLYDMGRNESLLGKILREHRHRILIATKVGNQWRADGSGWDWNPRKEYILRAIDDSLRRLGTDHIDLYQLHGGTLQDPIDETIDAFETLVSTGKILEYGISSIRPNVVREYVSRSRIRTLMCQYGVADRRPEEEILPTIAAKGIRLLARGVLAKGMLCGKAPKAYLGHSEDAMRQAATVIETCSSDTRTPVQTAIRFVLQRYGKATAVVGVSTLEQLEEMAATAKTPILTAAEMEAIASALPAETYTEHR
ncbi:MAG: aldo/keto reductase [Chitinophagia bacterium]|nr:aldo/keto reductase [Chitinophagia bacterium]